jgi:hypothetical protein
MHPAILGIVLGTQLAIQASDHVPSFNSETTCRVLSEKGAQSDYNDCLSDEKSAQQELGSTWASYSASLRARCTNDTIALGMDSSLDLLTCLKMKDDADPNSSPGLKRVTGTKP